MSASDQVGFLKDASSEEEREKIIPSLPDNFFWRFKLNHLKKYVSLLAPPETPTTSTTQSLQSTNHITPHQQSTIIGTSPSPVFQKQRNNVSYIPTKHPGKKGAEPDCLSLPTGIAAVDLDRLDEFNKTVIERHARTCKAGSLNVVKQKKEGFDLDRTYYCSFCKQSYEMSTGPKVDDPNAPKKRGRQMRPINKIMATAIFNSGAPALQVQEILIDGGLICPSYRGLGKMLEKVKEEAEFVSEAQLRQNRIKHNTMTRSMPDYLGDHKWMDENGEWHSYAVSPVAIDGNGEKRAYNHIITGDQHATVIVSLLTGQPLYVWHDQISCIFCQRKLTEILNNPGNKIRAQDLTLKDLEHPGKKCQRNSKHKVASAEEWALESLGKFMLVDPNTGKYRSDDEAILARYIVADGDTKGPKRFASAQAKLLPSFDGQAEYLPDIGHFIKCISNAFFALATNNAELRGKSLLDASRIRAMCSDIVKYLRECGDELRALAKWNGNDTDTQKDKICNRALVRIDTCIHHHCNDHEYCHSTDCLYRRTEMHCVAKYRVEVEGNVSKENAKPSDEILELQRDKIDEHYANNSRFSGMGMSMGKTGRAKVKNEITKRLDKSNIAKVSLCMSSNQCENYFSVLVKFTCGKRIYFGRKNGWRVRLLYAAAGRTEKRMTDKIRKRMGVTSTSYVREQRIAQELHRKAYQSAYQKTKKQQRRRKLKKLAKCKESVSNAKDPARHKSGKLSPKEAGVAKGKRTSVPRKRKNPCPNCKGMHPGKCPEPEYKPKRKKTKVNKAEIAALF
ncbi:hypothetical protein ACHAWF_017085 [Thalassiosira exigua]